jgi:hypothetical protein
MADEITTTEAAGLLGLATPDSARRALSRMGITPLHRQAGKAGESVWDANRIREAIRQRPGRGRRTDLTKEPPT